MPVKTTLTPWKDSVAKKILTQDILDGFVTDEMKAKDVSSINNQNHTPKEDPYSLEG